MSLILDALNRSDHERKELNQVPGLQSVHLPQRVEKRSGWRRLYLERWLILLIVLYLAFDFVYDKLAGGPPAAPPSTAAPAHPQAGALPARAIPSAVLEQSAAAPAATRMPPLAAPKQARVSPRPAASQREIEALYRADPEELSVPPMSPMSPMSPIQKSSAETDVSALLAQAAGEQSGGADAAYLAVPYITGLSIEARREIPTIAYSEHTLGQTPTEHRVRLNGRLLAAGQKVQTDLVLVAIYPEGIVLSFRGTEFRLAALNRWVNF